MRPRWTVKQSGQRLAALTRTSAAKIKDAGAATDTALRPLAESGQNAGIIGVEILIALWKLRQFDRTGPFFRQASQR